MGHCRQIPWVSVWCWVSGVYKQQPLTYVLTTAKLDATGHRWVAALSNYTFNILYKPGKANRDADALSRIKWPDTVELTSPSVHAVCERVQAPHGKIETLCHVVQVGEVNQDNMPPGMIPLEWSQAQTKDPALCQITEAFQHRTIGKLKIKKDMPSDLKAFLRIRKQQKLKQGILYRKSQVSNNSRVRLQLVLPIEYRPKAMAGCHDQTGHLGQDRVLELLRDRLYLAQDAHGCGILH